MAWTLTLERAGPPLIEFKSLETQTRQDANNNGLKLWGPDSFSIFPPFFKVHAKVTVDSSGSNVQNWAGLFACGVDSYKGLIAPLQIGFQNLSPDQINLASSVIVTVGTTLATAWALNLALSSALFWTGWGYALELALYAIAILAVITGVNAYPDRGVAKAVLLGIGFALITLTVAGFANDPRMATFPVILRALIPPTDPAYAAEKYVINSFIIYGLLTGSYLSAAILFKNPLMWLFAIATFVLGVVALYLDRKSRRTKWALMQESSVICQIAKRPYSFRDSRN